MRKTLVLFFAVGSFLTAKSQGGADHPEPKLGSIVGNTRFTGAGDMMLDPDWKSLTIENGTEWLRANNIQGTIFMHDKPNKGYIKLTTGSMAQNLMLQYDILHNQIDFMKDDHMLALDERTPVKEFGYTFINNDSAETNIVFRSGFPAVDDKTVKTFYQVLVDENIMLLKQYSKKLVELKNTFGAAERMIKDTEAWYVYLVKENRMIAFKPNKKSLQEALPALSARIEEIMKNKSPKLKSDEGLQMLFLELNY